MKTEKFSPKSEGHRRLSPPGGKRAPEPASAVWFWRKGGLEVWSLRRGGAAYDGPAKKSRLLPGSNFEELRRCLAIASWREARRAFRDSLRQQKR